MKPLLHARSSARKWGGTWEDYIDIHNFFDSTKSAFPDMRHRLILHSSFGIYIAERVFSVVITNSIGKQISVRDIGEQHVIEDIGFIPTLDRWLKHVPKEAWMFGHEVGAGSKNKFISFDNLD